MTDWGNSSFPDFMSTQSFTLIAVKLFVSATAVKQVSVSQQNSATVNWSRQALIYIPESWKCFEHHESYQLCGRSWRNRITDTVFLLISYENRIYVTEELWVVNVRSEVSPVYTRDYFELENSQFLQRLRLGLLYFLLRVWLSCQTAGFHCWHSSAPA